MSGDKTARRFISVGLPENIPTGPLKLEHDSRLRDTRVILHDGYVEIEMPVRIEEDVAGDLSWVHGQTMKMSFALRDYFQKTGWVSLVKPEDYASSLTPAPETYIDEMPVVACIDLFEPKNFYARDDYRATIG